MIYRYSDISFIKAQILIGQALISEIVDWAGNNRFQMQFSSIPTLIDAHVQAQLYNTPLKGASLFLYVSTKNPLVLEDATKIRVSASEDDLQAYFQSYDKIG